MKQFQFEYKNNNNFRRELARVRRFCETVPHSNVFFEIFTQCNDLDEIREITSYLDDYFPEANYYGCQSFGNIIDGKLSKDRTLIVCSVFEYETTKTNLIYIDPIDENAEYKSLDDLWAYCNECEWVKGVELTVTYEASNMLKIGEDPINLREDVQVFGAVAISPLDLVTEQSYIFAKNRGFSDKAAIAVILGGEDLHIATSHHKGWNGLGKHFTITKCEGKVIHEIDGEPAMDIYRKYLGIDSDENFLDDTMKFPMLVNQHGVDCIRIPMMNEDKDAIELTVNVKNNNKVRLSYGEPSTIISEVNRYVEDIYKFAPETIRIYSCAVRRAFWGDDGVSNETSMLDGIASTVGFYTRGELLRIGDYLEYFNATIVSCLVREGEAVEPDYDLDDVIGNALEPPAFATKVINYLGVVTEEIEGQYNKTITGFAQAFKTMLSIDLKENLITQLDNDRRTRKYLEIVDGADKQMMFCCEQYVTEALLDKAKEFCDLSTLVERLGTSPYIEAELCGKTVGWFRAQFIPISYDRHGELEQVLYITQIIDEDKKREEELKHLARTDEQTGLYNRRSYEEDIHEMKSKALSDRYAYVLIDINGLKEVNDTLGHAAGDELIRGAAACMKQAFEPYGKVYRIGGDEFAAIIFASENTLLDIRDDFADLVRNWSGEHVPELHVSAGYVSKKNAPNASIDDIERMADDMMYRDKAKYYKQRGGRG